MKLVAFCRRPTTLRELAALFEKHDFNAFPVVEDEMLLGIISKFDFLRAFAFTTSQVVPHYNELMSRPAVDVMTEAVVHVHATSPLTRVLQLMVSLKTRSFPVMSADGQLEGMISREDVMRALKETTQETRWTEGKSDAATPSDTVVFIDVSFTENGLRPRCADFDYALALGRAETAVCQRRRWPKCSGALMRPFF